MRASVFKSSSVFALEHASNCLSTHALCLVRDLVVALDPHGKITFLNPAAEQFYGSPKDGALGRPAKTTLFFDCKATFDTAWRTTLNHGEWRGQIMQRKGEGADRLVETCFSAVRDEHTSTITSILIVSTEIPKFNATAAGLAHEIRNPLASIKGVADTFLQRRQLTRQERRWMEAVRHEVMKIDARMRELLDVSRPRLSKAKQCSLSELIGNVVLLATHHASSIKDREGRKISLQFINATTKPIVMSLDPARLEDAVLNLVLNAIESIPRNGEVTISLRRSHKNHHSANGDGEALIEISDTGCGIPLENHRRIFQPRFTTKRDGTGLGLDAVLRTAVAYDGRVSFNTEIGRGSKFVLALPLSRSNLPEKPR